jgi:hypothetical protein
MNGELGRIWKEPVVARCSYYPGICSELVTIAGVPDETQTQYHRIRGKNITYCQTFF